jgi:Fe-only nitrogenase accessory protein AnfO
MCQKCSGLNGPEIAAILDSSGMSNTLSEPGNVVVYRKKGCSWEAERSFAFALDQTKGLRELRVKMAELLTFLGDCRIFVAKSASGALYFELEKAGCSIWEISGRPEDFLDIVLDDEEKERVAAQVSSVTAIPAPCERSPGEFYISIKEVQGKSPSISSKQVLQQFIRDGKFKTLEIHCDHVPPWIEVEAENRGFTLESTTLGKNEIQVILKQKT